MSDTEEHTTSHVVPNAVRLAGEALVLPGTSLLLDGKIGSGAAHAVLGVAARAVLGPIGWLLVAANSYTKSATGASLLEHAGDRRKARQQPAPAPDAAG